MSRHRFRLNTEVFRAHLSLSTGFTTRSCRTTRSPAESTPSDITLDSPSSLSRFVIKLPCLFYRHIVFTSVVHCIHWPSAVTGLKQSREY